MGFFRRFGWNSQAKLKRLQNSMMLKINKIFVVVCIENFHLWNNQAR